MNLALAVTDDEFVAVWLARTLELVPGWQISSVVARSRREVRTSVAERPVQAVLVDVEGAGSAVLEICSFLAVQYPLHRLVAVSCCGREDDDVFLGLLKLGLSGYVVMRGAPSRVAADLGQALSGMPVWPADRVARLAPRLAGHEPRPSDLDLRLIGLAADGRRHDEIAALTNLSTPTVRRRLKGVRRAVGTPTP